MTPETEVVNAGQQYGGVHVHPWSLSNLMTLIPPSHLSIQESDCVENQTAYITGCTLTWRQGKLLVKASASDRSVPLPPLTHELWLLECLRRSPIRLICIDPDLSPIQIERWAYTGQQAHKRIFLKLPPVPRSMRMTGRFNWRVKRGIEWAIAAVLLVLLSPLMLSLALVLRIQASGPMVTRQWCVGQRGKLFRVLKFRTSDQSAGWVRRYRLHKLPQLINVLRGEMSIIGPHPWLLNDLSCLSQSKRQQLNALPGMTGPWRTYAQSKLQDFNQDWTAIWHSDFDYLRSWSLHQDVKILLQTVPHILFRYGTH